jgi:hypothetical protein
MRGTTGRRRGRGKRVFADRGRVPCHSRQPDRRRSHAKLRAVGPMASRPPRRLAAPASDKTRPPGTSTSRQPRKSPPKSEGGHKTSHPPTELADPIRHCAVGNRRQSPRPQPKLYPDPDVKLTRPRRGTHKKTTGQLRRQRRAAASSHLMGRQCQTPVRDLFLESRIGTHFI